jgi:cation-transporting ATPase E
MTPVQGLTESEARVRRQRGEGNDADVSTGRSYWGIVRTNLFTFFNNLLFAIGIALVALGQYRDALVSVGLGLVNAAISTVQEINAKRKLDRIALLTRPEVTVVREGKEKEIDPAELVTGDVVRVRGGDQVLRGSLISSRSGRVMRCSRAASASPATRSTRRRRSERRASPTG